VYPPVIEVETTPPSSPTAPIVIQNNNSEDLRLKIELIPIKQRGSAGEVVMVPELITSGFYGYYKDRIQFLLDGKKTSTIDLEALEAKEVVLNINLQEGDPPGDYYYAIVFVSSESVQKESSISNIPTGIATNLLLSVGPRGEASGGISEFTTGTFKNSGPVEFSLKLHNASNHLIQPQGYIEIADISGRRVGKVEVLPQYVLSGADRYLIDETQATGEARLAYNESDHKPKIVWGEKFVLGFYKATASIMLEENGKVIQAVTYFIAFPLYLFFALAIVIFIILSVYLRVKKII
jgi:hypothetical protein